MRTTFLTATLSAFTILGCVGDITSGDDDPTPDPTDPPICETTRTYAGFGGSPLEADRVALAAGTDRLRLKPFAALAAEYTRALGLPAVDTSKYAATFGRPPARWYAEPSASANTIYGAFALAFDLCTMHTASGEDYAAAPTTATADVTCRQLVLRAWNRDATDDETAACVTFTVDQTLATDEPRRRWAYGCAAVLTASGFLAY